MSLRGNIVRGRRGLGRLAAALALAAGAGLFPGGAVAAATLEIVVRPTFNGEPLLLDSLRCRNAAGEVLAVTRLSYLLTGFALEQTDGGWVELPGAAAWMDAAQHRTACAWTRCPRASTARCASTSARMPA